MKLRKNNNIEKPRTIVIDSLRFKSKNEVLPFILQALLLSVTLVGFLYSVATSVDMSLGFGVIALIAVVSITVSMLFTLNKKVFIVFISTFSTVFLAALIFVKGLWTRIAESFMFCYNLTIKIMVDQGYTNYERSMTEDITELLENSQYMSECFYTVIIFLAIVFSVIFASTLVKRALIWISAPLCFLVLTPSLYYGSTPDGVAFSIFISGILGCYIESISSIVINKSKTSGYKKIKTKKNKPSLGRAYSTAANGFACMCVSLALSLTVSASLLSSDGMQIESIRAAIDELANRIMNVLFYENYETAEGAIGGLLEGDTLELKTPEFRDLSVMTVTTRTNSSLYLRGWIGKNLEGDGWKVLDDNDTGDYVKQVGGKFSENSQFYNYTKLMSPQQLDAAETAEDTAVLGFVYDTVSVKAKYTKSLMVFTPVKCLDGQINAKHDGIITTGDTITFFSDGRSQKNTYSYDAALQTFADRDFYLQFNEKQTNYLSMAKLITSKTGDLNEQEQFIYDERKYSEYVKATYLSVPDNSDNLGAIAKEVTANYRNDFAKALAVERYFKQNYTYAKKFTTAAGDAMQKVNYMINESKTGYCTYFATAMTVMMRQLGLPARYVTGYHAMVVADSGESKYVREIKDDDYHAWVEVYFDGIGWLSFDPTPGLDTTVSVRDYQYLDDPEWEEPEVLPPSDDPIAALPEVPEQPEPDDVVDVSDDEYDYSTPTPMWLIALIIAVSVIVILLILSVIAVAVISKRHKKYISSLHNLQSTELVRTVYPDIIRLLGSLNYVPKGGEMIDEFAFRVDRAFKLPRTFTSVVKTLEMSQFSGNVIESKDASDVFEFYSYLSQTVYFSLNKFKKYYYMATLKKRSK